jgi:predicted DNA-binding transcriptional regulator YafY
VIDLEHRLQRRTKQMRRCFRLLMLLSDRAPHALQDLADELGCNVRTARRDLLSLRFVGVDLLHTTGTSVWRLAGPCPLCASEATWRQAS